jgi:hypothetical protein
MDELENLEHYSDGRHGPVDPQWVTLERFLLENELAEATVSSSVA